MKTGKLYVIGVGPGDPELLTIKGMKILSRTSCICVPKGREEGSSLALSVIRDVVNLGQKEIIEAYFPMRKTRGSGHAAELDSQWNETVRAVSERLQAGIDMAFITIGDPTVYSTFFYLHDRLMETCPGLDMEIIPGVSSINAAAARAGVSLGLADEKIAVLPATYTDDLEEIIRRFDTVVLMKVHRVFRKVAELLQEMGLAERAVYVARAGMEDEKIFTDIRKVTEDDMNYFSLMIVRR